MADAKTIQTYNQLAYEYDEETATFWDRFPRDFLDTFITQAGNNILDVGCGPGRDGLILKSHGLKVIGLDASITMVKIALERGLPAVVGDFMALPFEDGEFSSVWAYTSLLHVSKTDFDGALQQIHRVLKPDGILALGMIIGEGEGFRLSAGVDRPRWFSYYSKEELHQSLSEAGFKISGYDTIQPRTSQYAHIIAEKYN